MFWRRSSVGQLDNAGLSVERRIRAAVIRRDFYILFRMLVKPLLFLFLAVLGGGLVLYLASPQGESLVNATYQVLTLSVFNPTKPFPDHPLLQFLYFFIPLINLLYVAILGTKLVDGLWARRRRSQEWEISSAAVCENHVVVCGLGDVGSHVIRRLVKQGIYPIVSVELDEQGYSVKEVQKMSIPVIIGDMTRRSVLEAANVHKAKAVLLTAGDDEVHAKIVLKILRCAKVCKCPRVIARLIDSRYGEALRHANEGHHPGLSLDLVSVDVNERIAHKICECVGVLTKDDRIGIIGLGNVGYAVITKLFEGNHGAIEPGNITIIEKHLPQNADARISQYNKMLKIEGDAAEVCFSQHLNLDILLVTTDDELTSLVFLAAKKAGKRLTVVRVKEEDPEHHLPVADRERVKIVNSACIAAEMMVEAYTSEE